MALIKKSWIKLIKLILVSKLLYNLTLVLYLSSLPVIFYKLKGLYSVNQETVIRIKSYLNLDNMLYINSVDDFNKNILEILSKRKKPDNNEFYILNSIRLVTYFHPDCSNLDFKSNCDINNDEYNTCYSNEYYNYVMSKIISNKISCKYNIPKEFVSFINESNIYSIRFPFVESDEKIFFNYYNLYNFKLNFNNTMFNSNDYSNADSIIDISGNNNLDLIESYIKYNKFNDKFKAIIVIINFYDVNSNTLISVKFGYESMLSKHNSSNNAIFPYYSLLIFNNNTISNTLFYLAFIAFVCSCCMQCLMLLFEINLNPKLNTQIFALLGEIFNLFLIVGLFAYYYLMQIPKLGYIINEIKFVNILVVKDLTLLLDVLLSFTVLTYPYKLIKFICNFNYFKIIYKYCNILYKLGPSLLLLTLLNIIIWFSFSLVMYILYGDNYYELSSLLLSNVNLIQGLVNINQFNNIKIINNVFTINSNNINNLNNINNNTNSVSNNNNNDNEFNHNSNLLVFKNVDNYYNYDYASIINIVIILYMFLAFAINIATILYNFRYAYDLEFEVEDPVIDKLSDIKKQIEEFNEDYKTNKDDFTNSVQKHQILWLNLTQNFSIFQSYNVYLKELSFIHFVSSLQIISFMKYIFGIRPQFQYIKLQDRFTIVIQCNIYKNNFEESKLREFENLVNWLNYIRSKIKIIVVSSQQLDIKNQYTISLSYENFYFITFSQAEKATLLYERYSDLSNLLTKIAKDCLYDNKSNANSIK